MLQFILRIYGNTRKHELLQQELPHLVIPSELALHREKQLSQICLYQPPSSCKTRPQKSHFTIGWLTSKIPSKSLYLLHPTPHWNFTFNHQDLTRPQPNYRNQTVSKEQKEEETYRKVSCATLCIWFNYTWRTSKKTWHFNLSFSLLQRVISHTS